MRAQVTLIILCVIFTISVDAFATTLNFTPLITTMANTSVLCTTSSYDEYEVGQYRYRLTLSPSQVSAVRASSNAYISYTVYLYARTLNSARGHATARWKTDNSFPDGSSLTTLDFGSSFVTDNDGSITNSVVVDITGIPIDPQFTVEADGNAYSDCAGNVGSGHQAQDKFHLGTTVTLTY